MEKKIEKQQAEIDALKDENQTLHLEKLQIVYNYGFYIIQNLKVHEEAVKANGLVVQLQRM